MVTTSRRWEHALWPAVALKLMIAKALRWLWLFPGRSCGRSSRAENPLGEWISVNGKQRQIVGVAEDGPSNYLHELPEPYLYLPFAQAPSGGRNPDCGNSGRTGNTGAGNPRGT